ncbi:MAG: Rab family GTPase [Pseudomonadota bacterium]
MAARALKILLLGALAVGKTSIANRLAHDKFDKDYKSTIGVQLYTVKVPIEDHEVSIVLWDTDGDMDAGIFTSPYVHGASGAMIVADTQRVETYETMNRLSETMDDLLPGRPHICIFNKTDIHKPSADVVAETKKRNEFVALCSAKDGTGVKQALEQLVKRIAELDYLV